MVNEALLTIEVENAPEIVSMGGQVRHHFREWTAQRVTADEDSLAEGYPVYHEGKAQVMFRGSDFTDYLRRAGTRFQPRDVWAILEEDGAAEARRTLNGKKIKVMFYPAPEEHLWFDKPRAGKF